jgi:protein phosphatase
VLAAGVIATIVLWKIRTNREMKNKKPYILMEKIALFLDIHGNIPALEAVISDIEKRGISATYCLGDLVGKGPNSELAVDLCRDFCDKIIMGNWDDFISKETENPVFIWHRKRLGAERLKYLLRLKAPLN